MATTPPRIKKILEEQKLTEAKIVSTHYHNYCSICLNEKGEKIYLKARLYPKLVSRENFIKEVILTKFLSENFYSNKYFLTPKYYAGNIEKKPEWMAREYIEGKRMGDVWGFDAEFYQKATPEKISNLLNFIRGDISQKFRAAAKRGERKLFKKHTAPAYKKYFSAYLPIAKKFVNSASRKKAFEIIAKYKKILRSNDYLAHGDLHPGNVVYNNGEISVHDWKYAHWDNPYLDFTFIWFLFWTDEKWQKEFFELELKRAENKDLFFLMFYLSVLKLTPKIISILVQSSKINDKEFEKGIEKVLAVFNKSIKFLE